MTKIQQRRGTAAQWTTANPVLALGEVGWETDTRRSKLGDGSTAWSDLAFTAADSGEVTAASITDATTVGRAVLTAADAAAARTAIGAPDLAGVAASQQAAGLVLVMASGTGVVGDGVADDTAALQALLDATVPGDVVLFRGGTYLISTTLRVPANRSLVGGAESGGAVIKAAAGSNLDAVVASAGWYSNAATSAPPIYVSGLTVDGNRDNNTAGVGDGIVIMSYRSKVVGNTVKNCRGDGIVVTDCNRAGTLISNSAVENRVSDNTVFDVTGHGIVVRDLNNTSGKCTDGYLQNNVVYQTGGAGIKVARAAGWFISQNHTYATGTHGLDLDNLWGTYVLHNEVDGFAVSNTGTCIGINANSILTGRPSVIEGNTVSANESPRPAATYIYYRLRIGSAGSDADVVFSGNTANADSQGGTSPRWMSFQPNSGTLRVTLAANVVRNFITEDPTFGTPGTLLLSTGIADLIASAGSPLGLRLASDELAAGVLETMPRDVATGSPSPGAGTLSLTYMTVPKAVSVQTITTYTRSTAGVGATASYVGLYAVDAATGDLTLLSGSDGTVGWASANAGTVKTLGAAVPLAAGQRIAVAVLNVGSTTQATLAGTTSVAGMLQLSPRKVAALTAQTTLPATITAASLSSSGANAYYARLT